MMADSGQGARGYRRGAIMGLTMAEAFILIAFALLLLFAFWHWENGEENTPEVQAFTELPYDQRQTVLAASRDGSLEAFIVLKEQGVDFAAPAAVDNPKEKWRFIDRDEVLRLMDAASELPDDIQRDLADLVESQKAQEILRQMAVLEELVESGQQLDDLIEVAEERQSIQDLSQQIRAVEQTQEAVLVSALQQELGGIVSGIGGQIDDKGSIILPDNILFEQGQATITPVLAGFLAEACEPWLRVLENSGVEISEVRIEGHASSEWHSSSSAREAYLGNLDLSQRRSQAVSRVCLEFVRTPETLEWAQKRMIAAGYSSARPVMREGQEDRVASRRVIFSVTLDREALLAEIESDRNWLFELFTELRQ